MKYLIILLFITNTLISDVLLVTQQIDDANYWKKELIRSAESRIDMFAGFAGGDILNEVLELFEQGLANKPALMIRFFIDDQSLFTKDAHKKRIQKIKESFPDRFFFLIKGPKGPLIQEKGLYTTQNHAKIIIVDDKYYLLGGTNLTDNLSRSNPDGKVESAILSKASNDMDIIGRGELALDLKKDFLSIWELWEKDLSLSGSEKEFQSSISEVLLKEEMQASILELETHPDLVLNVKVKGFIAGPRVHYHDTGKMFQDLFKRTRKSLEIGNLYFFPVDPLFNAMLQMSKRGINISLVTNGLKEENTLSNTLVWFYAIMNRVHMAPLMLGEKFKLHEYFKAIKAKPNNVQVYEYSKEETLYHKKVIVSDSKISLIGSYNFGKKSENSDYETLVWIESPEIARQIEQILALDKADSKKISVEQAVSWYYNPAYTAAGKFEGFFLDGIAVSMKKPPKNYNFEIILD